MTDLVCAATSYSGDSNSESASKAANVHKAYCKSCQRSFSKPYSYRRHLETVHGASLAAFPCRIALCNQSFRRKDILERHIENQHVSAKVRCPTCNKAIRKDALQDHVNSATCRRNAISTRKRLTGTFSTTTSRMSNDNAENTSADQGRPVGLGNPATNQPTSAATQSEGTQGTRYPSIQSEIKCKLLAKSSSVQGESAKLSDANLTNSSETTIGDPVPLSCQRYRPLQPHMLLSLAQHNRHASNTTEDHPNGTADPGNGSSSLKVHSLDPIWFQQIGSNFGGRATAASLSSDAPQRRLIGGHDLVLDRWLADRFDCMSWRLSEGRRGRATFHSRLSNSNDLAAGIEALSINR